jgi:hypothetical protein
MKELIKAQEEYIKLLSDELGGLAGYLHVHNIHPTFEAVAKGVELRERIAILKLEPKEEESQEEWKPNNDMEWYEFLYDIGSKAQYLKGETGPDEPEKMQAFLESKYDIRFRKKTLE